MCHCDFSDIVILWVLLVKSNLQLSTINDRQVDKLAEQKWSQAVNAAAEDTVLHGGRVEFDLC